MDDKIEELLVKKLDEGLTDTEMQELNVWLEEIVEHEAIFREMYKVRLWLDTGKEYNPNIESGFKKVRWKYRHVRMTRWMMRYTAILIVCLTVGTLFWEYRRGQVNEEKILVSDEFIRHGTQQAFFVWADGTRVSLGKEIKDTLISGEGAAFLQIDSNQMLYYKGNICQDNTKRYNQLIVPNGGEYRMLLEDGTVVWVNSASTVEIPEHFGDTERRVRLKGEAYFKVSKDALRPFVVKMNGVNVRVLGTSFNVRSYADEGQVVTTLVEGKVKVNDQDIVAGEQAVYSKNDGKTTVRQVEVEQYVAWQEGTFVFRNERLENVMKTLGRWYGVEFHFIDERAKEIRIGARFGRYDDMQPIVDMIKKTNLVEVLQTNRCLYISEKK